MYKYSHLAMSKTVYLSSSEPTTSTLTLLITFTWTYGAVLTYSVATNYVIRKNFLCIAVLLYGSNCVDPVTLVILQGELKLAREKKRDLHFDHAQGGDVDLLVGWKGSGSPRIRDKKRKEDD